MSVAAAPTQDPFANPFVIATHGRLEIDSPETAAHMGRVTELAAYLGPLTGISGAMQADLELAAALHDMTKTRGENRELVHKQGPLTLEETVRLNGHPLTAFLDINQRPELLCLSDDATAERAPNIAYLILTHHMHNQADGHRRFPDELPANYPNPATIARYAEQDDYIITSATVANPELRIASAILATCDVLDFNLHPGGRAYAREQTPASASAAVQRVSDQLVIPGAIRPADLLETAVYMIGPKDDVIAAA